MLFQIGPDNELEYALEVDVGDHVLGGLEVIPSKKRKEEAP